jgi:serine/threonine protein kinase
VLRSQSLLALKVCTSERTTQEIQVAYHLQSLDPELFDGLRCLRIPLDDFEVTSTSTSGKKHAVMVFTPLDLTWNQVRKQYEAAGATIPKNQVQQGLCGLICGLDVLHQAGIAHTDLYPNNIMFAIDDQSTILSQMAQMEKENPSQNASHLLSLRISVRLGWGSRGRGSEVVSCLISTARLRSYLVWNGIVRWICGLLG